MPTPGADHDAPAPAAPRGGVGSDGEPPEELSKAASPRPERRSGPSCAAGRGRSSSATTAQSAASTPWRTWTRSSRSVTPGPTSAMRATTPPSWVSRRPGNSASRPCAVPSSNRPTDAFGRCTAPGPAARFTSGPCCRAGTDGPRGAWRCARCPEAHAPTSHTCRATSSERSSTAPAAREPRRVGSGAAMRPSAVLRGTARRAAERARGPRRWSRFPYRPGVVPVL